MNDQLSKHQRRVAKVAAGIVTAFKTQFPHLEPEADFETIWPLSCWDRIRTETRDFEVKLKMTTGAVESITEVFD